MIEAELDEASSEKPGKKERAAQAKREQVLAKYVGLENAKPQFADPASMFG